MKNPYLCEDCFAQREARKRFDASNPAPDNRSKDAELLAKWDAERDAAIAASRHRAAVAQPEPEPTAPAFTSTYAADERAARAARSDRRAQIAEENAERRRLDDLIWAAGLSTEIQPRELSTSPLMAAAVERLEQVKADYQRACRTIAEMHAAALGEPRGPIRGVVEDVQDLRRKWVDADALAIKLQEEVASLRRELAALRSKEAEPDSEKPPQAVRPRNRPQAPQPPPATE